MTGAYLIDPMTGKLNPNAELLYWDPWDGHFLQNRFRQEYNVSVSGATDKTDYFISAGYLEDPSYIQGSSFNLQRPQQHQLADHQMAEGRYQHGLQPPGRTVPGNALRP